MVMTPRAFSSSLSELSLLSAPRGLNDPVFWKSSALKCSRAPMRSPSAVEVIVGVRCSVPAITPRAAAISSSPTRCAVSAGCIACLSSRNVRFAISVEYRRHHKHSTACRTERAAGRGDMRPKPKHWQPEYGAWFQDAGIVAAYPNRPPYPPETFTILTGLLAPDAPRTVLDVGCGTGDLARRLAPLVERVGAVDLSAGMIARGKRLPGGADPRIRWIHAAAEDAPLAPP